MLWLALIVGTFAIIPAHAEWFLGAYLGDTYSQRVNIHLQQPTLRTDVRFGDVPSVSRSFHAPPYYGFHLGSMFTEHFGLEAEFIHMKVFADTTADVRTQGTVNGIAVSGVGPMLPIVQRFNITHGLNMILVNGVLKKAVAPRVSVLGRAGVGLTVPHVESQVQEQVREDYQLGKPVGQVAAGVEIRTWRRFYTTADYKFTFTSQDEGLAVGHASLFVATHHVAFGLAWHLK